jgi:hypothetical protein
MNTKNNKPAKWPVYYFELLNILGDLCMILFVVPANAGNHV